MGLLNWTPLTKPSRSMSKAKITTNQDTSIALTFNKDCLTLFRSDLERLIDEHTSKEHFVKMAHDMVDDYLKMEGYDWEYDSMELERKLSIVFDNIVKSKGYSLTYKI